MSSSRNPNVGWMTFQQDGFSPWVNRPSHGIGGSTILVRQDLGFKELFRNDEGMFLGVVIALDTFVFNVLNCWTQLKELVKG